ncbi:hypothetical protein [Natronosalvus halobius]
MCVDCAVQEHLEGVKTDEIEEVQ